MPQWARFTRESCCEWNIQHKIKRVLIIFCSHLRQEIFSHKSSYNLYCRNDYPCPWNDRWSRERSRHRCLTLIGYDHGGRCRRRSSMIIKNQIYESQEGDEFGPRDRWRGGHHDDGDRGRRWPLFTNDVEMRIHTCCTREWSLGVMLKPYRINLESHTVKINGF